MAGAQTLFDLTGKTALITGSSRGLGLAIARSFVAASHGSIAITSPISDGRGTAVSIRLPLALAGLNQGGLAAAAARDEAQ